jgi:hypothetical protein
MTFEPRDPVIDALAALTTPAPQVDRARLVRRRCHAALTAAHARRPHRVARAAQRSIDRTLPIAAAAYGMLTVAEALRMIFRLP